MRAGAEDFSTDGKIVSIVKRNYVDSTCAGERRDADRNASAM